MAVLFQSLLCVPAEDLDEMNIEILRNTLYKAYLDDFSNFCRKLGGATAEIMNDILSFEVQPHECAAPAVVARGASAGWGS